jgi:hypothetical protein
MPKKYHGAKAGYEPPKFKDVNGGYDLPDPNFTETHKLDEEERKARRLENEKREKSRANHRKRKGHGRP